MKLEEAKKLVKELLESVCISKVYYVDDYLSYDGLEAVMKYIEDTDAEKIVKAIPLIPEEIAETKDVDPAITDRIQAWWGTLSNSECKSIIKVCSPDSIRHSESKVQVLLGEKCVFCSPEEWKEKHSNECLERIKKGEKILLLFDQILGKKQTSDGEGRSGLALAQSFSGYEGVKDNTYCGIFSGSFQIGEEFKFREEKLGQLSSWAFPFSKERVPDGDEYTLFIEGLNNLLWVGCVDELATMAQEIIADTTRKMHDEFGKILPLEFKQVVIDSSKAEGCREVDTLLRLIHIIFSRELHSALASDLEKIRLFNDNVNTIKRIDLITAKPLKKEIEGNRYDYEFVNSLFQDETFIPGEVVNRLLLPLQNGDVFCVDGAKYYVLLCQPCNISLRTGGKRSADVGYFVPLEEIKAEESLMKRLNNVLNKEGNERISAIENYKEKLHEKLEEAARGYSYRVKCSIEGKSLYALFNKHLTINLSILDYSTFSEDGQVVVNKECSPYLHANQKLLYDNHALKFSKILDLDHFVEGLGEDCHAIIKHRMENWFYQFLTKLGVKSKFENNLYIFPIKRVGNIQEPLSSDLLTQMSHYLSRAGLPNEFV